MTLNYSPYRNRKNQEKVGFGRLRSTKPHDPIAQASALFFDKPNMVTTCAVLFMVLGLMGFGVLGLGVSGFVQSSGV